MGPRKSALPLLQVLVPIITALITSAATVLVAYFTAVKPAAIKQAQTSAQEAIASAEVPIVVGQVGQNTTGRTVLIIALCGAALEEREIEGRMGAAPGDLALVSSALGRSRINFTLPVPPSWFYDVRETGGKPCQFRGWKL